MTNVFDLQMFFKKIVIKHNFTTKVSKMIRINEFYFNYFIFFYLREKKTTKQNLDYLGSVFQFR